MAVTDVLDASYLLDNAGQQARDRWTALSELFDEPTFRRLREVGLGPGWRCLEVGAGGGSVAGWLADRVGPTGWVVATDLDTHWLDPLATDNLRVVRHDITRDRLPALAYDLIHCRLVLTHLPDPLAVIDRLVRSLRPRGWLVIEEFDTSYLDGVCPGAGSEAEVRANLIREAFTHLIEKRGADLGLASQLPAMLTDRGFERVSVRGSFESGPAVRLLERANIEQVADELVAHGISAADLAGYLADLPRLPVLTPMMVSVVARKWPS